jgi:DNA-binding transcriptional MocR family regulator
MLKRANHIYMPKRPIYQELAFNPPKSEQTLQEWLFRELRSAILDGRLRPGARLPSSRGLALGNRLSRSTVTEAFRRLKLEGYITGFVGSGSYVAENLPDEFFSPPRGTWYGEIVWQSNKCVLLRRLKRCSHLHPAKDSEEPFSLAGRRWTNSLSTFEPVSPAA